MDYREARAYMKRMERYGSIPGLETVRELLHRLGDPQNACAAVQIVGTNGKGSTGAFLASICRAAGIRAGRFCSPAVFCERETISFDGKMITEEEYAFCMEPVAEASEAMAAEGLPHPTVFEAETALAYLFFSRKAKETGEKPLLAVIEAGMGGVLDATNVVGENLLALITSVSMDHMEVLGDSLEKIAAQKAGIIKKGGRAISAPQRGKVKAVLAGECLQKGAQLSYADPDRVKEMSLGLAGPFQKENAALAMEAAIWLREAGYAISDAAIERGLAETRWRGRFEKLGEKPDFWIDGAHNPDGARRLREAVMECCGNRRLVMIAGIFRDKAAEEMCEILSPNMKSLYTVTPKGPRGLPAEELRKIALSYCPHVTACKNVEEAVSLAAREADSDGGVLAFGSLSYLREADQAYNIILKNTSGRESKDDR